VRGYISGSAWKEYKATGKVCGINLPAGLRESDAFPEPIFTPSTKATSGHDENIPFSKMCDIVGTETASTLRDLTLRVYKKAADYAASAASSLPTPNLNWHDRQGDHSGG